MDPDLQSLIHFFTDREHLSKTIMMAEASQLDETGDRLVSQKGWYWGRSAKSERQDYLIGRRFVETELFDGSTREYGRLKDDVTSSRYRTPSKCYATGNTRCRATDLNEAT